MSYRQLREENFTIEQTNRLGFFYQTDYVTGTISFWQHYIPRASLTIIDGSYRKKEIDEIVRKAETLRETQGSKCSDCPRYISFTCRAEDLLDFAKKIIEIHDAESTS